MLAWLIAGPSRGEVFESFIGGHSVVAGFGFQVSIEDIQKLAMNIKVRLCIESCR